MPFLRFAIFAFLMPVFAYAGFAPAGVEKMLLENGLTVLLQPMPQSQTVSIYACVKTGSAVEGGFSGSGISHFVEHMLFKGTARRAPGAIAQEVKALGGTINASTTLDYTIYTLDLPKERLQQGLDIISDMLMNSAFDPQQTGHERQVIHGEMRLYNDRPDRRLSEDVFKNVYTRHPYRHPIIGDPAIFDAITRDQLYAYYRARYIPNNIILSVAGGFEAPKAAAWIKDDFKDFAPRPYPERNLSPEPPQATPRYMQDFYPTPLWRFSLAYPGVGLADPDVFALDVLAMALGEGNSSRLYNELYKNKHLVEEISASDFTPEDKGLFEVEGTMLKDNLALVQEAVQNMIGDIGRRGLSEAELQKTKRQVLSAFIFGDETSSGRAWRAAGDEAVTGDADFSRHYVEAVKRVTNEDIKRVARRYLARSALNVTVLKPQEAQGAERAPQPAAPAAGVEKVVLDNGLTVLLKEDHSSPIVALTAVANAGLRQEAPQENGISQLLSQVWTTGTQSRSDRQIARAVEDRGIRLEAFAGRNSVGLKVQALSGDLDFALGLMADLISSPLLSQENIAEEKARMAAAIDELDDDVEESTRKRLLQTMFLTHPYGRDVLGSKETLKNLDRKALLTYYRRFVQPSNMVIAVFGDLDARRAADQARRLFGRLKGQRAGLSRGLEPPPGRERFKEFAGGKEQAVVMYGFQAPACTDKDRWAMEVVNTVLGSGLSGRLFVKIRDELGKAYTVGSEYIPALDTGIFVLFVLTTAEKVDTVRGIIDREIEGLRTAAVSDEELASAKAYIKGTFKMGLNSLEAQSWTSAADELYGLGYDLPMKFDGLVDAVGKEDVQQAARRYLTLDKASVAVTSGQASKP